MNDRNEEKPKRNWPRILHWTFTLLLICLVVFLELRSFRNSLELGFAYGTSDYYVSILKEAEDPGFNTQHVADYMVYAYSMRKPLEPTNGHLEAMLERSEHFAMLAITQRLAERTGEDFGTDFDAWVEHFSSEESKKSYYSAKKYRLEKGIPANPLKLE